MKTFTRLSGPIERNRIIATLAALPGITQAKAAQIVSDVETVIRDEVLRTANNKLPEVRETIKRDVTKTIKPYAYAIIGTAGASIFLSVLAIVAAKRRK